MGELRAHGTSSHESTIIGLEHHTPSNIGADVDRAIAHATVFHPFMLYEPNPMSASVTQASVTQLDFAALMLEVVRGKRFLRARRPGECETMFSGWPVVGAPETEPSETVFWWLVRLRWVAVFGVAVTLLLAGPVLDRLPVDSSPWLWSAALALLAYNSALALLGPHPRWPWLTHCAGQIAVDCVALATFVHLAGGIDNPFLPLFVLHVVNASIALRRGAALLVLGLAITLLAAIVVGEGTGIGAHHCLRQDREPCSGGALDLRALAVLGGLVLTLVASSRFTRFLTATLRLGQRRLAAMVDELNVETAQLADTRATIDTERSRLQAIIDCMGDAVTFSGPDGSVMLSNQRARDLWRACEPLTDPQSFGAHLTGVIGPPTSCGHATFERGGRVFEATCSPVRNRQEETLGLVMVARDITERLAMEKHLMRDEQMSVVGKLAAAVAHEINNPIGVVVLYSQDALAKSSPESPIYKHLEAIHRNADSCRRITSDLLKLARPRRPERRPVDLRQLCREVIDSVRPLAMSAGVQISGGRHSSAVPLWADADAGLLHQAVLNLAVNAIEAAKNGDEVSIGAYPGHGGARVVEVRDTGVGIAADHVEQIFQPFFTTKPAGTGLGLSVAENIVKSHAGRIDVESIVGTGTMFRIVLPERTRQAPAPGAVRGQSHPLVSEAGA